MKFKGKAFVSCLILLVTTGWAEVQLNPLFTDHMVLQRNQSVPIYGTSDPGERVSVSFAGQEKPQWPVAMESGWESSIPCWHRRNSAK